MNRLFPSHAINNTPSLHSIALPLLVCSILLVATVTIPGTIHAQSFDESTVGRTYLLAFPDTVYNRFDRTHLNRYPIPRLDTLADRITIHIYSALRNQVEITGENYSRTITLPAGQFTTVDLNAPDTKAPRPILDEVGVISDNTFRLEALFPIKVYCYIATSRGGEAWTPLPVECWGIDHYAGMNPGDVVYDVTVPNREATELEILPHKAPSTILILAAYDSTVVTLYPTGQLEGAPPTTITLNANQAYQVQSLVDLNSLPNGTFTDLGGTRIVATRPVGILAGNTQSPVLKPFTPNALLPGNTYKNMLYEWLLPVEHHGTEFAFLPVYDALHPSNVPDPRDARRSREFVRVYGTAPQTTTITYTNGTSGTATTAPVDKGQFIEFGITPATPFTFRTDAPVQMMVSTTAVSQYRPSTDPFEIIRQTYETWAPAMVTMIGRENWGSNIPFLAPAYPVGMRHYVNIVTEKQYENAVVFEDGTPFDFNHGGLAGSDLIWGTMELEAGKGYLLEGRDGATFSGFVYGSWKGYESFLPQGTRKKNDDPAIQSGVDKGRSILHPAEYDEISAVSYSYPLTQIANCCLGVPETDDVLMEISIADNLVDSIGLAPALIPVTLDVLSPDAVIQSLNFNITYDSTVAKLETSPNALQEMVENTVLENWGVEIDTIQPGYFSAIFSSPDATTILDETGVLLNLNFQKYLGNSDTTPLDFQVIPGSGYCSRVITNPGKLKLEICGLTERLMEFGEEDLTLKPVAPNPVTDHCTITFSIPFTGNTSLKIYDTQGRLVAILAEGILEHGKYSVRWNAGEHSSGHYYYQLRYGNRSIIRSLLLAR